MSLLLFIFSSLLLSTTAEYTGIWWWTWSSTTVPPNGTVLSIAFSGWTDPDTALSESSQIYSSLQGERYLSFGGGNANGRWSSDALTKVVDYCLSNVTDYDGVSFDIEEGDAGLAKAFADAFSACQDAGLKVIVTVSHSAPYGIADAIPLMKGIISDTNVYILSPQLYSTGSETTNDYTTTTIDTVSLPWSEYSKFSGSGGIVPSIVASSYYLNAKSYFAKLNITLNGYIQWNQGGGKSPDSSIRCGVTWNSANTNCGTFCHSADSDCPSGEHCYSSLSVTPCTISPPVDDTPSGLTQVQVGLIVAGILLLVIVVVVVCAVLGGRLGNTESA